MKILILYAILALFNTHVYANNDFFNDSGAFIYEIGGADLVHANIGDNSDNISIGTRNNFNLGYSCGKFDISASFSNLMNDFKNGVDDAVNAVVNSANAAISSLPMLALQRAQPGLYSMFKEYQISAETDIDIAQTSCEQFEADIAQGGDPLSKFLQNSKLDYFQDEASSGSGDIVRANKSAKEEAGVKGVDSYGQKRGGQGNPPVLTIENTAKAGFNYLTNQNPSDPTQNTTTPVDSNIGNAFSSGQEAANWITQVVGELEINNQQPITKVGKGLRPKVAQEREKIITQINNNQLDILNETVKQKISARSINQQQVILSNIAHTEALKNTIDKALTARRILLAGAQDQSDSSNNDVKLEKIDQLEKEIDNLMFDFRLRKELTNDTIITLLKDSNTSQTPAATVNNDSLLFK